MNTILVTDPGALRDFSAEWDVLATAADAPFCAPVWALAWLKHAAPAAAELRCILVTDDDGLVGIAPFYVNRSERPPRLRMVGSGASLYMQPLARRGHEREVAAAITACAATMEPRPSVLVFDGVKRGVWPDVLAQAWPGGAWTHTGLSMPAPYVVAPDGYDAWFASKSSNFRQQMRRDRRKLESAGALWSIATPETAGDLLHAFARLHHARWSEKGGSGVLTPQVEAMLHDIASEWVASGRLRIHAIEIDGDAISVQLFVAGDRTLYYWLGGFDDAWADTRPSISSILAGIADGLASGLTTIDLGAGGQDYKYRLADGDVGVDWVTIVPRGPGYVAARAALAPSNLRRAALDRMPDGLKDAVKARLARHRGRR